MTWVFPTSVRLAVKLLREAGDQTLMSGKWHLGLSADRAPHARGFERSFSLLPGPATWQLYDLGSDPGEVHDLALSQPERLNALIEHWQTYVEETGVILSESPFDQD